MKTAFVTGITGQDGSNAELLRLIGKFEFTSFRRGIDKTYE
jgi:GDP-D-mannose dehydratase